MSKGTNFESWLKKKLRNDKLDAWHLGFTEGMDLIVINHKDRLIECKLHKITTLKPVYYFSKHKKQHEKILKMCREHPENSYYYAIKFWYAPRRFVIRFFYVPDICENVFVSPEDKGYTYEEFVEHVKKSDVFCKHYDREEINLVLDGKTEPVLRCKICMNYISKEGEIINV